FPTLLPDASPDDFSATIDWGDGSEKSQAVIVAEDYPGPYARPYDSSGDNGAAPFPSATFAVLGGHTYDTSGTFTAAINIADKTGHSVATTADINVADSALVVQPITEPFQAIAGASYDHIPVADFTNLTSQAGAEDPTQSYTATIDWGDGSTSAGDIEPEY